MNITPMTKEDVEEVYEIECSIFSRAWSKAGFLDALLNEKNYYLVVKEGESVIAYCGLTGILDEGYITNVAVKSEYQGRGIGKEMLISLLNLGREKGLKAFTLEVRTSNEKAIKLYQGLGFLDMGVRKNFYEAPQEDALIMWLYD